MFVHSFENNFSNKLFLGYFIKKLFIVFDFLKFVHN